MQDVNSRGNRGRGAGRGRAVIWKLYLSHRFSVNVKLLYSAKTSENCCGNISQPCHFEVLLLSLILPVAHRFRKE